MANEITMSAQLSVTKGSLSLRKNPTDQITMAGTHYSAGIQTVGTTYEAIALDADIGTAGVALFLNTDSTNYVELGLDVGAAFYALVKLMPGEFAVFRLATGTFYGRANTSAVGLEKFVLESSRMAANVIYGLTEDQHAQVMRHINTLRSVHGPGVSVRPRIGMTVRPTPPPKVRRPPVARSDRSVTFRLTNLVGTDVGMYYAKSIAGPGDVAATGALAEADLGTIAAAENLIAWHTPEIKIGATKHLLALDGHYVGTDTGLVNGDGLRIVKFSAMPVGETASPTTIGDTDEGSETADTAGWSRTTDGTPLTLLAMTRVAYFHAGDKKLYGYMREIRWDAAGFLLSVSAETRIEVDAAAAC